jgi:hypothetical protein
MAALVDEIGLVDEMKPKDFKPVSDKLCHGACRVVLLWALSLFAAVAFAGGQASQQAVAKNAQSTTAPTAIAPSS